MQIIDFELNWNGKLYCNAFSTIRLMNEDKYQLNQSYQLTLNKTIDQGTATLIYLKHFTLKNITEAMALIDTGYSSAEAIQIFKSIHHNIMDIENKVFTYMILKRNTLDINQNNQLHEITTLKSAAIPIQG